MLRTSARAAHAAQRATRHTPGLAAEDSTQQQNAESRASSRNALLEHSTMPPCETCTPQCTASFLVLSDLPLVRATGRSPSPPPWEKVLWRRQAYPDNYVDESFLDSLICNANMRAYVYADLCRATAAVTQHVSLIVAFTVFYIMFEKKRVSVAWLFAVDFALLFLGFTLRFFADDDLHKLCRGLWSAVVGLGCLRILAPILRTLTQAFSEDTVVCLSVVCLLVHAALTDYSYIYRNPGKVDESLRRAMSINAALLANVVLASRLSSSTEVFAVLIFGIEIFALSPVLRRILWQRHPWAFVHVLTPALILSTALIMVQEAPASVILLFLLSMVFITFVGPYWLISSQKYKHEIRGPWDVAEVPNYA